MLVVRPTIGCLARILPQSVDFAIEARGGRTAQDDSSGCNRDGHVGEGGTSIAFYHPLTRLWNSGGCSTVVASNITTRIVRIRIRIVWDQTLRGIGAGFGVADEPERLYPP